MSKQLDSSQEIVEKAVLVVPVEVAGLAVVGPGPVPQVTVTVPAVGAEQVGVIATLTVQLSTDVVAGSIQVMVKDHNGIEVAGEGTFEPLDRTFRFVPSYGLAPGSRYSAAVWGATDGCGRVMETHWWHFTTAGEPLW
jgi:Bacterial Ig-like domain